MKTKSYSSIPESEHLSNFNRMLSGYGNFEELSYWELDNTPHKIKCHDKEDKGKTFYVGNTDNGFPVVTIGSHAHGMHTICSYPRDAHIDINSDTKDATIKEEAARRDEQWQRMKKQAAAKARALAIKKGKNVQKEIADFPKLNPTGTSTYFEAKDVTDLAGYKNVRFGKDKHSTFAAILLHSIEYGQPCGVQKFYDKPLENGSVKKFTWGMTGHTYHIIGDVNESSREVLFCEGFPDGLILHSICELPVIVTLNTNNLEPVAAYFKAKYPQLKGTIVCDNDAQKYDRMDNVGVLKGIIAARKTECHYVIPDFKGLSSEQIPNPTDIWDLWQLIGDDAVKELPHDAKEVPSGIDWLTLKLGLIGLRDNPRQALKPLKSALFALISNLCRRAPFKFYDIKANITAIIAAQTERLGEFPFYNESQLLQYADFITQRIPYLNTKKCLTAFDNSHQKADEMMCSEWLNVVMDDHDTLVIDSPLGTGKTEWIKQQTMNGQFKSVLFPFPRRSLAKNMAIRFSEGQLEIVLDYEDVKAMTPKQRSETDMRFMTIVPNSFPKVGLTGDEMFDCLVLDEFELLIELLYSAAISDSDRPQILNILRGLIRNAEKVIVAQAGITQLTTDFLESCDRKNIHVIRNIFNRFAGLPISLYMKKADCMMRLTELCDANVPVMVPCSSLKFTRQLFLELSKRYTDKRIMVIDRNNATEDAQAKFLANPNVEAPNWDIIIHSPVLEQGVSIDVPHFKNVVGFCNSGEGTGTPDSFVQMLFRSRVVEKLDLYCDQRVYNMPTDYEAYLKEEIARYHVAAKAVVHDGKKGFFFEETDDVKLAAKTRAKEAASKNDTIGMLYAQLTRMECQTEIIHSKEDERTKAGQAKLKSAQEMQKIEYEHHVQTAIPINSFAYDDLKNKRNPTQNEQWQIKRYELESEVCLNLDSLTNEERNVAFKHWNQGRWKKPIQAIGEAVLGETNAQAVTRYLLLNKPQNSFSQSFRTRYLVRSGLLKSLGFTFKEGEFSFEDHRFKYSDFKDTWWYRFACENKDAINGSGLGARIKGRVPSDNEIGLWIRAMGIKLKSHKPDSKGKKPQKQMKIHSVNAETMQPLLATIKRRYKAGEMPWQSLAEKYIAKQEQELETLDEAQLADSLLKELKCDKEIRLDSVGVDWLALVLNTTRDQILKLAHDQLSDQVFVIEPQVLGDDALIGLRSDTITQFVNECCTTNRPTTRTITTELYDGYQNWCFGNGNIAQSNVVFSKKIKGLGYKTSRVKSVYFWSGIGL